jgi:hypothetical protein
MVSRVRSLRAVVAVLIAVTVLACGNGPKKAVPIHQPPAPTPTPGRPAPAMLQVENAPDSRPHSGLQNADIVYEYLTEGGITRFTAVYFKPSGTVRIGPDRSARLATLRLLHSYGGVLFYSGASDKVLGMIWDQHIPSFDDRSDGGRYFSRDASRRAPHNLYTSGDQLAAGVEKSGAKVTYQLLPRGEPGEQPDAQIPHFSFNQTFAHSVAYTYDEVSKSYTYKSETGTEVDAGNGNQPLRITNVVLVRVPHHGAGYTEDVNGEEGIDFDLQGQGKADVYTRGGHLSATWDLSDPNRPLRLIGADGQDVVLPEGLTWIHLVDPGMPVNT